MIRSRLDKFMIPDALFLICNADNLKSKIAIIFHMFEWVFSWMLKIKLKKRLIEVSLKDINFVFKSFSSELAPYNEIYRRKIYELHSDFIASSSMIVFDIGANLGFYAISQAKRGAIVYAFEPNLNVFNRLRCNISLNSLNERIKPFCKAFYSFSGKVNFEVNSDFTTLGHVVGLKQTNKQTNKDLLLITWFLKR